MKSLVRALSLILVFLNTFMSPNRGFTYSISTHESIAVRSVFTSTLDANLQSNFALSLTISFSDLESNQTKTVLEWISTGSVFEDGESILDVAQPRKHFHSPITNQGLSDTFSGVSAVNWAINDHGNNWSWIKTREYFYQALTAQTEVQRNHNFSKMFRGLGQIIHLIQDSSVPEHVRNDMHLFSAFPVLGSNAYEPWVAEHINPIGFSATAFLFPANYSLRNLWDSNLYVDSPDQQGPFVGLAEYTSYNFFSEDTIFTERLPNTDQHYFPHPRKEFTSAALIEEIAEDGQKDQVYYVHGYQANLLAAYSYLSIYIPPYTVIEGWRYNMDPNVYQEYAGRLIPQAISYSAGLLNYFFRGELDAQADGNDGIKITNNSIENIDGTFELYYDDKDGKRKQTEGAFWTNITLSPGATSDRLTFTPPTDAARIDKYVLVFRGIHGAETDAVAGKVLQLKTASYVFIIQETAELKSQPRNENGRESSEVYFQTLWDECPQMVTGRFVVYGSIEKIILKIISPRQLTDQLFINGQPAANNTWVAGSSTDEPKTWKVERSCRNASAPPWLEVQLADGDVFTQPVIMYNDAGHTEAKKTFGNLTARRLHYAFLGISDSSYCCLKPGTIPGLGTLKSNEQFKFVQVNNHSPTENHEIFYQEHIYYESLQVGFELKYFGRTGSLNPGYYQISEEDLDFCGSMCFENMPLPEPLSLTLTAQMDRIYTPKELDHLKSRGINPQYYSIIFK